MCGLFHPFFFFFLLFCGNWSKVLGLYIAQHLPTNWTPTLHHQQQSNTLPLGLSSRLCLELSWLFREFKSLRQFLFLYRIRNLCMTFRSWSFSYRLDSVSRRLRCTLCPSSSPAASSSPCCRGHTRKTGPRSRPGRCRCSSKPWWRRWRTHTSGVLQTARIRPTVDQTHS